MPVKRELSVINIKSNTAEAAYQRLVANQTIQMQTRFSGSTDEIDGFFKGKRYLIHDRDPLYTREFVTMLAEQGIESVKLPPRAPNLNAHAERFVRTIKEDCLEQMILWRRRIKKSGS